MGLGSRLLFEDEHCLAIVKAAGQFSQGSWAPPGEQTLEGEVREYLNPADPSSVYLGIVHRLDRPVSGLLVWAKTTKSARRLSQQFEAQEGRERILGDRRRHRGEGSTGTGKHWSDCTIARRGYLDRLADLGWSFGRGPGCQRGDRARPPSGHSVRPGKRVKPAPRVPLATALARDRPNPPAPRAGCAPRIARRGRCELRGLETISAGNCAPCAAAGIATSHTRYAAGADRPVARDLD